MIAQLKPQIIVTVVRSIGANVERARLRAKWQGLSLELPYPGRWKRHRIAFDSALLPVLRTTFGRKFRKG
jgi:hypothetical protein